MTEATVIGKTPNNRPSSPRQFFERLYGHLESNETSHINRSVGASDSIHSAENITSSDKDTNCVPNVSAAVCDSTYQSDDGSLSSPEISINDERLPNSYDPYSAHEYDKAYYASRATIPNIPFGFPGEPHFAAGFTAFRE
ncbi:unnamed protein product [Ceratitis capitata]|uniref:(Mediterranean fruit fly) hypothetical protein n=1 Tax=Ceratitis capitata TaxID=7213 RepID=A0A811U5G8_CERCA|nr:unnamed protein product [Ceratitis capitata]